MRKLLAVVDRLRDPEGGCPWDLEQTPESLAPSLVEEAHELLEALETGSEDGAVEEAGDLLMGVVLVCRIAEQAGRFDLARVGEGVCAKLIRRHPHVFGEARVDGSAHALANWERIKQEERREKRTDASALAGVPRALPALQRTFRIGEKAIAAGFRWTGPEGALAKLREEVDELFEVYAGGGADAAERLEEELGDVLLAGALAGNYLGLDPERALRRSLRRFEERFRSMESELGGELRELPLERLVEAWQAAKERLQTGPQ